MVLRPVTCVLGAAGGWGVVGWLREGGCGRERKVVRERVGMDVYIGVGGWLGRTGDKSLN